MFARRLRRRFRILSVLPAALWVWKERHVLAGMAGFAKTVPDRVKLGRASEVGLAAKVNLALLREPGLKGADVRLGAVKGGDVCLEVGRGSEAAAEVARRLVEGVPGVASVRVQDASASPAPDAPNVGSAGSAGTVAGAGAVEDLRDGAVDSPTGEEAPVRI